MTRPVQVYVGHIPQHTRKKDVERFFSGYGKINEIVLKRGYGFVLMDDDLCAADAINDLHGQKLCGVRVIVNYARETQSAGLARGLQSESQDNNVRKSRERSTSLKRHADDCSSQEQNHLSSSQQETKKLKVQDLKLDYNQNKVTDDADTPRSLELGQINPLDDSLFVSSGESSDETTPNLSELDRYCMYMKSSQKNADNQLLNISNETDYPVAIEVDNTGNIEFQGLNSSISGQTLNPYINIFGATNLGVVNQCQNFKVGAVNCPECGKCMKITSLNKHHKEKHSLYVMVYKCPIANCPYDSNRLSTLKQHMVNAHKYKKDEIVQMRVEEKISHTLMLRADWETQSFRNTKPFYIDTLLDFASSQNQANVEDGKAQEPCSDYTCDDVQSLSQNRKTNTAIEADIPTWPSLTSSQLVKQSKAAGSTSTSSKSPQHAEESEIRTPKKNSKSCTNGKKVQTPENKKRVMSDTPKKGEIPNNACNGSHTDVPHSINKGTGTPIKQTSNSTKISMISNESKNVSKTSETVKDTCSGKDAKEKTVNKKVSKVSSTAIKHDGKTPILDKSATGAVKDTKSKQPISSMDTNYMVVPREPKILSKNLNSKMIENEQNLEKVQKIEEQLKLDMKTCSRHIEVWNKLSNLITTLHEKSLIRVSRLKTKSLQKALDQEKTHRLNAENKVSEIEKKLCSLADQIKTESRPLDMLDLKIEK